MHRNHHDDLIKYTLVVESIKLYKHADYCVLTNATHDMSNHQ